MKVKLVYDGNTLEIAALALALSVDGTEVFARTETPKTEPIPQPPDGFSYADPQYDRPAQELLFGVGQPALFRNGKPVWWNWQKWMEATGRPDPEKRPDVAGEAPVKTGPDLNSGARRENPFTKDVARSFFFDIEPGTVKIELVHAAMGGSRFNKCTEALSGPGQDGRSREHELSGTGYDFKRTVYSPSPGRYTWTVSVDEHAECGTVLVRDMQGAG